MDDSKYQEIEKINYQELRKENRNRMKAAFKVKSLQLYMMGGIFLAAYACLHYITNYMPDSDHRVILMIMIKIVINAILINIALIGMEHVKKSFNIWLIVILGIYAIGDIITYLSMFYSGMVYAVGHCLFIILLYKNTFFRKIQIIITNCIVVVLVAGAVVVGIAMKLPATYTACLTFYVIVSFNFLVLSFNNPFYVPGAVMFIISDVIGIVRISLINSWWTYLITNFIYYLAIILISLSLFNLTQKTVVTFPEFQSMIRIMNKHQVKYWMGGSWNASLINNLSPLQIKDTCFICDIRTLENLQGALLDMQLIKKDECITESCVLYGDKFGTIKIILAEKTGEGVIVHTLKGVEFEIENEYLVEKQLGKITIPYMSFRNI